jgi:hypothetical protein
VLYTTEKPPPPTNSVTNIDNVFMCTVIELIFPLALARSNMHINPTSLRYGGQRSREAGGESTVDKVMGRAE